MIPFVLVSLALVQQGTPAPVQPAGVVGPTYRFGDYDGDGLADVYVVRQTARDRLYRNLGDGTFVDVTDSAGLSDVSGTRLALWQDFDGDGALDLYVCTANGRSRLFRNEARTSFVDVTLAAGVGHRGDGEELFAEWIDFDLDGWSDLHVVTSKGDRLWRNLRDGRFERAQLPAAEELDGAVIALSLPQPSAQSTHASAGAAGEIDGNGMGGPLALGNRCPQQLKDAATGNCTSMSTTPTLGMLYPLSTNLNVDVSGNVGMGTATPGQRLDVAGNVRASGQLMSSVTTGTAPLAVSSTTKVTNFNADTLDGVDSSAFSQLGSTIEGSEITDGTVDVADIAGSAVTTGKLANSSVTSGKISDGTIATIDIAAGAITNSLIASGAVGSTNIALAAVGSAQLANGSVGSAQLAPGAVGTAQLAADAVDSSRVLNGSLALADLASNSIDGSKIVDGSVDVADLAGSCVTSGKIANGTIATVDIANNAITSALLANGAVGSAQLGTNAVGLPNLNTSGATTGQLLGFNGSGASWMTAPSVGWTPISSLPFTINQPGAYYLTGNLTGVSGQYGIKINVGSVAVDLNNFELGGVVGSWAGIHVASTAREVRITHGVIRGWSGNGIEGYGTALALEDLRLRGNAGTGVYVDAGPAQLLNCMSTGNSVHGFDLAKSLVRECTATGNVQYGFYLFETCQMLHCTATDNQSDGVNARASSAILECFASANGDNGIEILDTCVVARNYCMLNGVVATGANATFQIVILGRGSMIDENNIYQPSQSYASGGIQLGTASAGNQVVRNSILGGPDVHDLHPTANATAQPIITSGNFVDTHPWGNLLTNY